jgi:hypothetical protein
MFPIRYIMSVPNEIGHRQFAGYLRFFLQLQPQLFGQPVAFKAVDPLIRQHAILPSCLPPSRTRKHMIDITFMRGEFSTGVLAFTTIPLPDSFGGKFWAAFRNLIVACQDKNSRYPDQAPHRPDRVILFPNRQIKPFMPANRTHFSSADDIKRCRVTVRHHAKGVGWRLHINRLPIPVQDENRRFIQDVVHSLIEISLSCGRTDEQMPYYLSLVQRGNLRTRRIGSRLFEPT